MSLACYECHETGAFDTLILRDPTKEFDLEKPVSHFRNLYVHGSHVASVPASKKRTEFMIVVEKGSNDSWNTGTDGDTLGEAKSRRFVSEKELKKAVPKIFAALKG